MLLKSSFITIKKEKESFIYLIDYLKVVNYGYNRI